jgi:hypothetical protein
VPPNEVSETVDRLGQITPVDAGARRRLTRQIRSKAVARMHRILAVMYAVPGVGWAVATLVSCP